MYVIICYQNLNPAETVMIEVEADPLPMLNGNMDEQVDNCNLKLKGQMKPFMYYNADDMFREKDPVNSRLVRVALNMCRIKKKSNLYIHMSLHVLMDSGKFVLLQYCTYVIGYILGIAYCISYSSLVYIYLFIFLHIFKFNFVFICTYVINSFILLFC
jgi:hypothetical protein